MVELFKSLNFFLVSSRQSWSVRPEVGRSWINQRSPQTSRPTTPLKSGFWNLLKLFYTLETFCEDDSLPIFFELIILWTITNDHVELVGGGGLFDLSRVICSMVQHNMQLNFPFHTRHLELMTSSGLYARIIIRTVKYSVVQYVYYISRGGGGGGAGRKWWEMWKKEKGRTLKDFF